MDKIWFYRLENKKPVPCRFDELEKAFTNFQDRSVGKTEVGRYFVSTVFLCVDHSFCGEAAPLLFETMIFDAGKALDYQERYATWGEAEAGHAEAVKYAENLLALDESEMGQ